MGEYATVRLDGAAEFDEVLRLLPKEISWRVLNAAVRAGTKPIVDEAKRLAPVGTRTRTRKSGKVTLPGALRDSIGFRRLGKREGFLAVNIIGPRWPAGAHGVLVEFGTFKATAKPFLRPAWDAKAPEALKRIAVSLRRSIDRAALKLAGPLAKSGLVRRRRRR